jgi:2'-5' RNA ligase
MIRCARFVHTLTILLINYSGRFLQAGTRWPAHITLHFLTSPSYQSTHPPQAFHAALSTLQASLARINPFKFRLGEVGSFGLKGYESIHLSPSSSPSGEEKELQNVFEAISSALGLSKANEGRAFKPHLTLAQASHSSPTGIASLKSKARKILDTVREVEWSVGSVVLLRKGEDDEEGRMEMVHEIFLGGEEQKRETERNSSWSGPPVPCRVWKFDVAEGAGMGGWEPLSLPPLNDSLGSSSSWPVPATADSLKLATYNILHDPSFPISSRIHKLLKAILAKEAEADVLCLQEVSDEALGVLYPHPTRAVLKVRYSAFFHVIMTQMLIFVFL